MKVKKIDLSVESSRESAKKLYTSLGFKKWGEKNRPYTSMAIILTKNICPSISKAALFEISDTLFKKAVLFEITSAPRFLYPTFGKP